MIKEIIEDEDKLVIKAENGLWDKETLAELNDKYAIVFNCLNCPKVPPIKLLGDSINNSKFKITGFIFGTVIDNNLYFEKYYNRFTHVFSIEQLPDLILVLQNILVGLSL